MAPELPPRPGIPKPPTPANATATLQTLKNHQYTPIVLTITCTLVTVAALSYAVSMWKEVNASRAKLQAREEKIDQVIELLHGQLQAWKDERDRYRPELPPTRPLNPKR